MQRLWKNKEIHQKFDEILAFKKNLEAYYPKNTKMTASFKFIDENRYYNIFKVTKNIRNILLRKFSH